MRVFHVCQIQVAAFTGRKEINENFLPPAVATSFDMFIFKK